MNLEQTTCGQLSSPCTCGAWKHYALVALLAGVILFWNLGGESFDDHEAHSALTARTMADANAWLLKGTREYPMPQNTPLNHWLVPIENGRPRLVKTPLMYWLTTLGAKAGLGVTHFSARLPSALAALACALVLLAVGRRMFSSRAALLGALMFVTSQGFQRWGRNARPEMMLCLWITAAMGCFYLGMESTTRRGRAGWMAAFWLAMGMGNLSKEFVPVLLAWPLLAYVLLREKQSAEPDDDKVVSALRKFLLACVAGLAAYYAILLVPAMRWWHALGLEQGLGIYLTMGLCLGLPIAWLFFTSRGWRPVVALLPTAIPGVLVMLVMFVPWMWYMHHVFPGTAADTFSEQVTERAAGTGRWLVDSPDPYARAMALFPLPWLAFLPGAFAVAVLKRFSQHRRALAFLTLWLVGILLLFMAAAGKREHYIFPAMPALCLLMGFVADDVFFTHLWVKPNLAKALAIGYGVVAAGCIVGVAVKWGREPQIEKWPYLMAMVVIGAVPAMLAGVLALRGRLRPVMGLLFASMTLVYVANGAFCSHWDDYLAPSRFFQSAGAKVPREATLYSWASPQPQGPFYAAREVPAVQWQFDVLVPQIGQAEADRLFRQWMSDPRNAEWMLGFINDAAELSAYGYQPTELHTPPIWRKKIEYVLFHRNPPQQK